MEHKFKMYPKQTGWKGVDGLVRLEWDKSVFWTHCGRALQLLAL